MTLDDLRPLWLVLAVVAGIVVTLVADVLLPLAHKRVVGWLAAGWLAAALAATFFVPIEGTVAGGAWVGGAWVTFLSRTMLAAGVLGIVGGLAHVAREAPLRQGEYHVLVLASVAGMVALPGARDLLLLVVCFELMGMPLYLLAAYAKTDRGEGGRALAPEASLKLYLVGAMSTAVTLFGLALVWGMGGSLRLDALANVAQAPLVVAGMLLVLAGLGFKIGLVPFHAWIPDTYQGAWTTFVAFLSVGPKIAGVAAIVLVFNQGFGVAHDPAWLPAASALCLATMTLGNVLAVPQTSVKRLLAYSGIGQIGYVLMALVTGTPEGVGMALFYLAGYVVTNTGAFLVVHAVSTAVGGDSLEDFRGVARRTPWLGAALLVFLLSLAGIPFAVGFWAKLYVFLAAWHAGLVWLVVAGAVLATVGLFYYLQVARAAYLLEPTKTEPIRVPPTLAAAIVVCLLAVLGMGLYPRPFLEAALTAAGAPPATDVARAAEAAVAQN